MKTWNIVGTSKKKISDDKKYQSPQYYYKEKSWVQNKSKFITEEFLVTINLVNKRELLQGVWLAILNCLSLAWLFLIKYQMQASVCKCLQFCSISLSDTF